MQDMSNRSFKFKFTSSFRLILYVYYNTEYSRFGFLYYSNILKVSTKTIKSEQHRNGSSNKTRPKNIIYKAVICLVTFSYIKLALRITLF